MQFLCTLAHAGTHTDQHLITRPLLPPVLLLLLLCAGKLKEFKAYLESEGASRTDIRQLREEVEALANAFPMPGL